MRVEVGDVGLEVAVEGEEDGAPVVLLHGWPDRGRLWRHQVPALVAAGHRVVVPDRVDRLAVLSVGHPSSIAGAGLEQRQLSWYMLLFQFEGVAERWLSDHDWANLREFGAGHVDLEDVIADLSRPGALTASLNWYRANVPPERLVEPPMAFPPVRVPTLGVWSSGDVALTERQMTGSAQHVTGPWRYERIEGASHWLQLDEPDRVNELLVDFLGGTP